MLRLTCRTCLSCFGKTYVGLRSANTELDGSSQPQLGLATHLANPASPFASRLGATDTGSAPEGDVDFLNLRAGRFLSFLLGQLQNDSTYQPPKHVKDFTDSLNQFSGDIEVTSSAEKLNNIVHSNFGYDALIRTRCKHGHEEVR